MIRRLSIAGVSFAASTEAPVASPTGGVCAATNMLGQEPPGADGQTRDTGPSSGSPNGLSADPPGSTPLSPFGFGSRRAGTILPTLATRQDERTRSNACQIAAADKVTGPNSKWQDPSGKWED